MGSSPSLPNKLTLEQCKSAAGYNLVSNILYILLFHEIIYSFLFFKNFCHITNWLYYFNFYAYLFIITLSLTIGDKYQEYYEEIFEKYKTMDKDGLVKK